MDSATAKIRDENFLTAIKNQFIHRIETLLSQDYSPNGSSDECQHPLDLAIELGNLQVVSLLIDRGARTDSPIEPTKQQIALHRAVIRGNKEIITKVLQHTATPSATDMDGSSVLHLALQAKSQDKVIEIMKIFLDLGMNVDLQNLKGETPLFVAGKQKRREVVEFLIKHGAYLNARDRDGNSLIHHLLKDSKNDVRDSDKKYFIDWLLSKGADVNCTNNAGEYPLQLASRIKSRNAIRLLLKHTKDLRTFRDSQNRTILHMVLELGVAKPWEDDENPAPEMIREIEEMIDFLLDKGLSLNAVDDNGNTPFHLAVEHKKWFAALKLLEHVENLNARNNRGQTPLHVMMNSGDSCQENYVDALDLLLSKNVDIGVRDNDGFSPFHVALQSQNVHAVKKLMQLGVDVNAEVPGTSVLHLAVGCGIDVMRTLVRAGSYFDIIDNYGFPPLHYAMKLDYDGMAYLLEAGADVGVVNVDNDLRSLVTCKSIRRCLAKFGHAKLKIPKGFGAPSDYTRDSRDYRYRDYNLGPEFHRECQIEVQKLKDFDIDGRASLYDFLHLSVERRISFLGLEKLQDIVKLPDLEFNFPHYCDIIIGKHLQAVEWKTLLEPAQDALRQIANGELPDICVENIFRYLNKQSLSALIRGAKVVGDEKSVNSSSSSTSKKRRIE